MSAVQPIPLDHADHSCRGVGWATSSTPGATRWTWRTYRGQRGRASSRRSKFLSHTAGRRRWCQSRLTGLTISVRILPLLRLPFPVSLTDNLLDVCGFFFRDVPNYQPDFEVETFLHSGAPPVYIGFGSIVVDDPLKLTATIVQAVRQAGCRAIISRGWSKLGADQPPSPDILWLGDCPHEWLFQHVAAVVHHGGAGTTACGLLHARPTAIVPFFGE